MKEDKMFNEDKISKEDKNSSPELIWFDGKTIIEPPFCQFFIRKHELWKVESENIPFNDK